MEKIDFNTFFLRFYLMAAGTTSESEETWRTTDSLDWFILFFYFSKEICPKSKFQSDSSVDGFFSSKISIEPLWNVVENWFLLEEETTCPFSSSYLVNRSTFVNAFPFVSSSSFPRLFTDSVPSSTSFIFTDRRKSSTRTKNPVPTGHIDKFRRRRKIFDRRATSRTNR